MQVQQDRLRADIESNAEFGKEEVKEGHGRTVLTGTSADRNAREHFVERLEEANLSVRVDEIGTIVGRWTPEQADPDAAPIAAGSHLDSVPNGGIFDGPLGVYGALEAVRAIRESEVEPIRPLEVVSWTEEEGARFTTGLLGSSVAAGIRSAEEALTLEDDDGVTVGEALDEIGFRGDDTVDASEWDSWFELHIEQGTKLEDANASIGVVDAISGITNCRVTFSGEANHAGATPMYERRDALVAASEFIVDNEQTAREVVATKSDSAVGTVGKIDVTPNASNVVPGEVEVTMDIRDVNRAAMETIVERAHSNAVRLERDRPVETKFERYRLTEPSQMAGWCVDTALSVAEENDITAKRMHSAALHDTANVAECTDTVLLFAPSRDGISHNPLEWTDWEDCAAATQVLAESVARAATRTTD